MEGVEAPQSAEKSSRQSGSETSSDIRRTQESRASGIMTLAEKLNAEVPEARLGSEITELGALDARLHSLGSEIGESSRAGEAVETSHETKPHKAVEEVDDEPSPDSADISDQEVAEQSTDSAESETSELAEIIGSERWNNLVPNYPSAESLLPRDLSTEQIVAIMESVADPVTREKLGEIKGAIEDLAEDADESVEIPGVGTLKKLTPGESSIPYVLTTESGKKLTVILMPYSQELGVQSPDDPRMFKQAEKGGENLWQYSTLRTYLVNPIEGSKYGVKLQEYGGENRSSSLSFLGRRRAKQRALEYIKSKGDQFDQSHSLTRNELDKGEHYLSKGAVIDIPVVERV